MTTDTRDELVRQVADKYANTGCQYAGPSVVRMAIEAAAREMYSIARAETLKECARELRLEAIKASDEDKPANLNTEAKNAEHFAALGICIGLKRGEERILSMGAPRYAETPAREKE